MMFVNVMLGYILYICTFLRLFTTKVDFSVNNAACLSVI